MFYSHEILANTQYGVATIWMIATTGKGSQRKITKKAINEVNVPKACKTFTNPEAPLALRLQGNLLYGVSRVFEQKTGYVLSDAERIQSDMLSYFRVMKQDNIDPQGGKAKRQNINLPDDPNFDPFGALPGLDLLNALQWNANVDQLFPSQKTDSQKVSQFTPLASQNSSGGRGNIIIDLPDESSHGSYRLPSDLGRNSPAGWKSNFESAFGGARVNDQDPPLDLGFDFDAEGNMIDFMEPGLPAAPVQDEKCTQNLPELRCEDEAPVRILQSDDEEGMRIMQEQPLPDAEAFPTRKTAPQNHSSATQESETTETTRAAAAKLKRRARTKKSKAMMDSQAELTRHEMKEWQTNYVERMDAARDQPKTNSIAQARKNALNFLYVGGIAGVGFPFAPDNEGFVHPLAGNFSGELFKAQVLEREIEDEEDNAFAPKSRRPRRRQYSEAFTDE